jgi:general stress protein YciG
MAKKPTSPKPPAKDDKDKAAQSLGQRGGRARAAALSAERRSEIARKAVQKRWEKRRTDVASRPKKG